MSLQEPIRDSLGSLRCNGSVAVQSETSNAFPALTHASQSGNPQQVSSLPGQILSHLFEEGPKRGNLAPPFAETVGRLEVFVAAPPPETPGWVNDQ
jgi:hypothetical protein